MAEAHSVQGDNDRSRRYLSAAAVLMLVLALAAPAGAQTEPVWLYAARPGDTIWDLSRRYLKDWRLWPRLQALNHVDDPARIPPGRIIRIPIAWLLAMPTKAVAAQVQPPAEARYAGSRDWHRLEEHEQLLDGDWIATGSGGSVMLRLADGTEILVPSESRVAIEQLLAFPGTPLADTRLRLEQGRLVPSGVPKGSRLSIGSPPATTSVRGTDFRMALKAGGALGAGEAQATTETLAGTVAVAARGRTARVPAGFGAVTRAGAAPQPPVPLLPPPDPRGVTERVERLPFTVSLPPLPGAVAYRFELAEDGRFATLLIDTVTTRPEFRLPAVADGRYAWRARGIDRRGIEGRDAVRAIEVNARPEPPAPLTPRRLSHLRDPAPRFAWAEPVDAAGFRFQLARAEAPERPLVDRADLSAAAFTLPQALPPGAYVWRVATRAADGEIGPFSDPQPFVRVEPLPAPVPEVIGADSERLVIRLPQASEGARYQMQLARDPAFREIVLDRVLAEPELEQRHLHPGRYYLRARTIEADGWRGAFGEPQQLDLRPTPGWPVVAIPLLLTLLAAL